MRLTVAVALFTCVACASTTTPPPAAGPEPLTTESAATAAPAEMTLEEALAIADDIQSRWPLRDDHPLREAKTLEDAEKILKLDQVTLFAHGIEIAQAHDTVEAMALHGQIELAWAEAYMILVDIMAKLHKGLGESLDTAADEAEMQDLKLGRDELERAGKAFTVLLAEHLKLGWEKASQVMEKYPDSYLGYRVAADYYRLVDDWDAFAETIAKIKERNPDSNGLRFLQGVAAALGQRDRMSADAFYRDALEHDPNFVRAQAHLLMIQATVEGAHREYLALKEKNPDHQVVSWLGDRLEKTYENWKSQHPDS